MGDKGASVMADGEEGRLMKLFVLLKLLTNCRALLDIVAEDILKLGKEELKIFFPSKGRRKVL